MAPLKLDTLQVSISVLATVAVNPADKDGGLEHAPSQKLLFFSPVGAVCSQLETVRIVASEVAAPAWEYVIGAVAVEGFGSTQSEAWSAIVGCALFDESI